MRAFELAIAKDAAHAVALLAEHGPSVRVLAGGTDLLVELKSASHVPRVVVDISRAADSRPIRPIRETVAQAKSQRNSIS
jgi:CO/xanthine dehydrogenase FAD-binding subunit